VNRLTGILDHSTVLRTLAYLIATFAIAEIVDRLLRRQDGALSRMLKRPLTVAETTRLRMVRRLVVAAILFVGIGLALLQMPQVGTLARGMLASAGITALIVGFAARTVLANLVSGVLIAFSQPVRIGDYVLVDGIFGTVEEIRLTYSYIRTPDNRRIVIPNEQFASKVIQNYSIVDPESAATVEFTVPVTVSLPRVKEIAEDEAGRAAGAAARRAPHLEVAQINLDNLLLRLQVWVADPPQAAALGDRLRLAVAERLKREGIIGGP
jgi:small-conductance mechanosensitive channel